jgi:glutathione S-transferase
LSTFIITTFDWVPEVPRGYVRDIRLRWALEEAGLPYDVEGTPFENRKDEHFSKQPFGQVPWLTDGDVTIFESGAILLYLAERSDDLMPGEQRGRNEVIEWLFAALNSVELATVPWSIFMFSEDTVATPGRKHLDGFVANRLLHMEQVLSEREWLAREFSVADIAMSDALRLVDRFGGLDEHEACREYISRATKRPAFMKAYQDQVEFYAAADAKRNASPHLQLDPAFSPPPKGRQVSLSAMRTVRHISICIARSPGDVYEFASNPVNLPLWAEGLAQTEIEREGQTWIADAPFGRVRIRFAERNTFGVMDHDVELDSGEVMHNPMRVFPNGSGSEFVFSLIRQPGMSEEQFVRDGFVVEKDLRRLKDLLER